MTVDIKSDLHLDFWMPANKNPTKDRKNTDAFINSILPENPGQVLVLAGDLSHYNKQTKLLLQELKKYYKDIVVVYGNHDMYLINGSIQQKYRFAMNRIQELSQICAELGVHFLDGQIVEIDGVKFGGLCGWYNVSSEENLTRWLTGSNDSRLISPKIKQSFVQRYQNTDKKIPKWDTNIFYQEQLQKLYNISEAGCDILISHVPQMITPRSYMDPEFRDDLNNIFYYVDNFDLIKRSGAKVYIHGHVHNPSDYTLSGIRILCSPYGYPEDTKTLPKSKQIQI